jgi:hypothetical protein
VAARAAQASSGQTSRVIAVGRKRQVRDASSGLGKWKKARAPVLEVIVEVLLAVLDVL